VGRLHGACARDGYARPRLVLVSCRALGRGRRDSPDRGGTRARPRRVSSLRSPVSIVIWVCQGRPTSIQLARKRARVHLRVNESRAGWRAVGVVVKSLEACTTAVARLKGGGTRCCTASDIALSAWRRRWYRAALRRRRSGARSVVEIVTRRRTSLFQGVGAKSLRKFAHIRKPELRDEEGFAPALNASRRVPRVAPRVSHLASRLPPPASRIPRPHSPSALGIRFPLRLPRLSRPPAPVSAPAASAITLRSGSTKSRKALSVSGKRLSLSHQLLADAA
jgi:hypothetical protein